MEQVIRMISHARKPRRGSGLLTSAAFALLLTACSDSSVETTAAEGDANPAVSTSVVDRTTTASVDAPNHIGEYDMDKVLAAGVLPDLVLGDENAPVTIVEYASMTCGHCATFHEETWPELKEAFVDTGKVRFILREFPFDPRATAAFMLARCSGDNYHPLVDVLFKRQNDWARAPADQAAAALFNTTKIAGFTQESFRACLQDQELLDNVNATRQKAAEEFAVDATPTFFINGKKYTGALTFAQMSAIIGSLQ